MTKLHYIIEPKHKTDDIHTTITTITIKNDNDNNNNNNDNPEHNINKSAFSYGDTVELVYVFVLQ